MVNLEEDYSSGIFGCKSLLILGDEFLKEAIPLLKSSFEFALVDLATIVTEFLSCQMQKWIYSKKQAVQHISRLSNSGETADVSIL
jgi:hypothetical protein